jgi:hypothetical protein
LGHILIVGGGIGGLALALDKAVGVGVNLLPHSGDKPFARVDEVISPAELREISEHYKRVAGYDRDALKQQEGTR